MAHELPFTLMLITDEAPDILARVSRALEGCGSSRVAVQLRRKQASTSELLDLARMLRSVTQRHEALLIINAHADVARAVAADGVHLPQGGRTATNVRALLPKSCVGRSCHSRNELEGAEREGADYAMLSPVHAVPGKGQPLGIAQFGALTNERHLPIVALGGLKANDVPALRAGGAQAFAVIRAILGAEDPARASAHFMDALARAGMRTT